jgi:hypothetical protein
LGRVRTGLTLIAAVGALCLPAAAEGVVPPKHQRANAKKFARAYWAERGQWTHCSGVRFRFRPFYGVLAGAAGCTVTFNQRVTWNRIPGWGWNDDWWRLCLTAIHEYGHLRGMPYDGTRGAVHSQSPNSVMASSEQLNTSAWWWPFHPDCRFHGDDADADGYPDFRAGAARGGSVRDTGMRRDRFR